MTQLLYDGQKATNLDLLHGDTGWMLAGSDAPLADNVQRYYEYVGLLYRCTHVRADSLSKVPWVITNDSDETLWKSGKPVPASLLGLAMLPKLLRKTEAALTLGAQAYWHKEKNRVRLLGLRWFSPVATAPYWDVNMGLTHFERNLGTRLETYPVDDIVYVRYEHPLFETERDRSPAEAALRAAGVLYNVDEFTAKFFERGAIKATLLTVKGNPPKTEMDRIKQWWKRFFQGVTNAFGAEVLNSEGIAPVVVGEGISELSNTDLTEGKSNDVAITLGVPLSMIFSDAANHATAQQDEQNFYNSTIVPECDLISEQVNEQLLEPMGLRLVFKPEAMDVFQADENERSQSFATYVAAGMPPELVAEMLGIDMPDGWDYDDLKREEQPVTVQPTATTTEDEPDKPPMDEPRKAEARRFKAWASKRNNPDVDKFNSDILSRADKAAILSEMEGGIDQDFFPSRLKLSHGPITPDAFKALLLQLDPDDDEAEQRIREEIERRLERELSGAMYEQLSLLLPEGADDETIRAAAAQVTATSEGVREVLRRHLSQSSSLGVTVALDTLNNIGYGFDWTLAHNNAAQWASQYSFELVRGINQTTANRLQVAVDDWFRERTTLPDLVKELQPTFGRRRAKLIAQTETTRAATEGTLAGFREAGFTGTPSQQAPAHPGCRCWVSIRINDDNSAEFIWLTANDERVCPVCGPLHGRSLGFAKGAG